MKDANGKTLPHFQYTNSGYDRGHLANAEDFAYSEESLRSTFYYINAIPQWPSVNRGTWQSNEKYLREESQNDSIIIVCGGCDWTDGIPKKCFKIAYSLSSGLCYQSYVFYNDSSCWISVSNKVMKQFPYKTVKQAYEGKKFKKLIK
jgi:DNA/RNA endonuclease G (NUC1)